MLSSLVIGRQTRQLAPRLPYVFTNLRRFKTNFHRPDSAGSSDASDAADAAATVLADKGDMSKSATSGPNIATWLDALTEREKQLREGKILDSYSYVTPKTTDVTDKTRSESFSYLLLPFKDDKWLCDAYINAYGRLRVGQLFQDLDALAGRIGYRHTAPAEPVNVTASVDRIYMVKKVDEISNYNFVLAGAVIWTGRSSMEISVKGYAYDGEIPESITEDTLSENNVFLTANFTFVARNPVNHKSFAINRLLPTSEKEWIEYRRAESHNAKKKMSAKDKRLIEPTEQESKLIYDMWRSSKKLSHLKDSEMKGLTFMKNSKVQSTLFMQPQYRNRHSYMIFGGYLLRQTFELAYCASAAFASAGPRFVSLDSTNFKAPVPVGSVLSMTASVSYTEHIHDNFEDAVNDQPFDFRLPGFNRVSENPDAFLSEPGTIIQVRVDTTIARMDVPTSQEAGSFIYSFFVPKSSYKEGTPSYTSVIPQTYSEMMEYVEGRRRAQDTANFVATLPRNV